MTYEEVICVMAIKCIVIGNRIRMDDGIGIRVAENLMSRLKRVSIEVILGETDQEYILSRIDSEDLLILLDATYYGIVPGTITVTPIVDIAHLNHILYTQHDSNLISLLKIQGKNVDGYMIGIEIDTIDYGVELSDTLSGKLQSISDEVFRLISQTLNVS